MVIMKEYERIIKEGSPNCQHEEYEFNDDDYYYHCKYCSRVTEDLEVTGDN